MSGAGIDRGRSARTNRNVETGIHYGVIGQSAVSQAWSDSAEPDYGEPTCPKCGNEATGYNLEVHEHFEQYCFAAWARPAHGCADFACTACELTIDSEHCFPEQALSWNYQAEGYDLHDAFDGSCIFVVSSPYFTRTRFCSPCAPGAGDLDNPLDDGVETYCLSHDWFDEGRAPYPVWSVETRELIQPESYQ